ncbi:UNVERIFIED_CONTAM: hypothetical protein HDU68_001482 [Siphonaria sp. JEL0065]|nr:hypothetical protein HDU68_001482 [Siphonaria sp. JEL0065]
MQSLTRLQPPDKAGKPQEPQDVEEEGEIELEDPYMELFDWTKLTVYTITPIVIICVAASLLYKKVNESHQYILANQTIIPRLVVNGSGSTMMATTFWRWTSLFHDSLAENDYVVDAEYLPTGSSTGLRDLFAGGALFASTEGSLVVTQAINASATQAELDPSHTLHYGTFMLPIVAGALAVVCNIPGISINEPPLMFDGNTLAAIFSGQIVWWNDTRIQSLNMNITLPRQLITPIVLNDPTDIMPTYLATYYPPFQSTTEKIFSWPSSFIKGNSAFELMYISGIMSNSITYTPIEALLQAQTSGRNPTVATIINKLGEKVAPSKHSVEAALASAFFDPNLIMPGYLSITDRNVTGAYPLSFVSFVLLRQNYYYLIPGSKQECLRVKFMLDLILYAMTDPTATQSLSDNGWNPIGGAVLDNNLGRLGAVTCNNENVKHQLDLDREKTQFYTTVDYEWDTSITFWSNLNSLPATRVGLSIYLTFYVLLILSNAIPFIANMCHIDEEKKVKVAKPAKRKVKWT